MISKKAREAAAVLTPASAPVRRKRVIGAVTGLAVAATLAAVAVPAAAQGQGSHGASSGHSSSQHHYLSPLQVTSAYYNSYNGDLAAAFDRYISKDLVLHGFNGPESREGWIKGDLEIKAGLSGFKMTVLDQIVEGDKVVTRWSFGGVHTGTIFGIPASGREVHLSGISIDRVVKGQSIEHWSEGNFGVFLDELRGETRSAE
ncbi:ester cyclase [Streptomyces sp. NBC_01799]|uniref:ester cyclase n=1 Tax=Streptomyces sp. NBC_01800 TaxID=2975945 RepID=UPI002DD841FF|nr:ester cyclase [Streptomyces sp. NBC_01800]WSA65977.1 ester cyclase [Streptomyces sp. NBC_01800]WSA74579.1 ester cyclase [Streptomyces sp. NBC_01799]